ncbi:MAG: DUF5320 domain-containing protein [Candidatus Gracilibacteria bacterium]|jgi:hypothetical protein|nr:DUF5320 domain-containing protein [Candidatus Gracilibacteria bacterium]
MPNFDGTGPSGKGQGTGRRMGTCGAKMDLAQEEKILEARLEEIRKAKLESK